MTPQIEIILVAIIVSISCSLLGVFLVLRKMTMMTDAISHTILLGIVLAFFVTKSLNSPLLIIGAALLGLVTVYLTEIIKKTKLVSEDSSIGIVFPFLFSIAIILITKFASDVHLDIDSVLLGELAFVPFDRMLIGGVDIGAKSLYVMGTIMLINIVFILIFYKELKIVTFDNALAYVLGFSPVFIHYALMTLVSVTAVGAFEAVGSILVIAFIIGPPITAYMITSRLKHMIIFSILIGVGDSILGYIIADYFDVSIAGSIASIIGFVFILVFLISPRYGVLLNMYRRYKKRYDFAVMTLVFHINNHEDTPKRIIENNKLTLHEHLQWNKQFCNKIVDIALNSEYIHSNNGIFYLTNKGKQYVNRSYKDIGYSNV